MQFDASGRLWITAYSKGELVRIEPNGAKDFRSEVIPMPEFAKDMRPAPYSLGVNPKTGDVWVNEGMTDHAYRYLPAEKRWIAYPLPLMGTFTRDMTFTKEGYACMSTNPSPLAALEGGVAELICIRPEGDVKVEARAD
jgi:streptogramin lyase